MVLREWMIGMRVKTNVIIGRKLKELPRAHGKYQTTVKSKLAERIKAGIQNQNTQQTERARSERQRQKEVSQKRRGSLQLANQIKSLKKLTPLTLNSSQSNVYKTGITGKTQPLSQNLLKPKTLAKSRTSRLQTVGAKLAEKQRQIQAQQKYIRQQLDLSISAKIAGRIKVSAALQAKQKQYAKKRAALLQRQAGVQKAITIRSMRLGEGGVVSSNVAAVNYDEMNARLYVAFLNGSEYEYDLSGVSDGVRLAINVWSGNAFCKTHGVSQYNGRKWWETKHPSVGAAVWRYLRRSAIPYKKVSSNVRQYQQTGPNWPYPSSRGNIGHPMPMP